MFRFLLISCLTLWSISAQAQVQILTSIKPLQLIAAAIQDGQGEPQALLPPGASPHYFVLRPSDAKRLDQADLFYWIGPDLENFLPRLVKQRSQPSVPVQTLPELQLQYFGAAQAHAEDEHQHEHGHTHAYQGYYRAHGKINTARQDDEGHADGDNAENRVIRKEVDEYLDGGKPIKTYRCAYV